MHTPLQIIRDRFTQAFTACMTAMTQGDITVISLDHFFRAGRVGMITAVACVLASFIPRHTRWVGLWLTGVFTAVADYVTHPSQMPGALTECLITGLGAFVLAVAWDHWRLKRRTHYEAWEDDYMGRD